MQCLRVSRASVGRDVVAKRASAQANGAGKSKANSTREVLRLGRCQSSSGAQRMEARTEERFIRVDVSDPGENGLIEENRFDEPRARTDAMPEACAGHAECIGSESSPEDREVLAIRREGEPAEAPGISEHEGGFIIQCPRGVPVFVALHNFTRPVVAQLSAHSQVNHDNPSQMIDDGELLSVSLQSGDRAPQKHGRAGNEMSFRRGADIAPVERDGGDTPSDDLSKHSANGFNLGELGHVKSVERSSFRSRGAHSQRTARASSRTRWQARPAPRSRGD